MDIEAAADSISIPKAGPLDLAALLRGAQEAMMKSGDANTKDGTKSNKSRGKQPPKPLDLAGLVSD